MAREKTLCVDSANPRPEPFDNLTPKKVRMAMPLDLKIDRGSGEAYVSGAGGYLRSYASAFVASSSSPREEGGGERGRTGTG
jgi:hypothetical protein